MEGTLQHNSNKRGSSNNFHQKINSRNVLITSSISNFSNPCLFCNSSAHNIYSCQSFMGLPIDRLISKARRICLCLNCLRNGHSTRFCRSKGCKHCKGRHHSLLHLETSANNPTNELNNRSTFSPPFPSNHALSQPDSNNTVLTSTLNSISTS